MDGRQDGFKDALHEFLMTVLDQPKMEGRILGFCLSDGKPSNSTHLVLISESKYQTD